MSDLRARPTLGEITRDCFGDDLGGLLLQNGAVVPLTDPDRPKACILRGVLKDGWHDPDFADFHGLAIICGPRSGITVWDFDDLDLLGPPIEPPNVLTTKGCHVYAVFDGERRKINVVPGLDVLGEGGIAVFHAPGAKEFIHPNILEADLIYKYMEPYGVSRAGTVKAGRKVPAAATTPVYNDVLPVQQSGCFYYNQPSQSAVDKIVKDHLDPSTTGSSIQSFLITAGSSMNKHFTNPIRSGTRGTSSTYSQADYPGRVRDHEFELDIDSIVEGEVVGVARAKVGTRNAKLYRAAIELHRCRVDPVILTPAGLRAGLDEEEVAVTIDKAKRQFNEFLGGTVLDEVLKWQSRWTEHYMASPSRVCLISELARYAIAQNTLKPFISLNWLRVPVRQPTKSKYLAELRDEGAIRIVPRGRDHRGRRRPQYYELLVDEPPIEDEGQQEPASERGEQSTSLSTEQNAAEATVPTPRRANPQIEEHHRKQPVEIRKISTMIDTYLRPTSGARILNWQKISLLVFRAMVNDLLESRGDGNYVAKIEGDGEDYSLVGTLDEWTDLSPRRIPRLQEDD